MPGDSGGILPDAAVDAGVAQAVDAGLAVDGAVDTPAMLDAGRSDAGAAPDAGRDARTDGGPSPDAGPDCTRAASTATAQVALLDSFRTRIAPITSAPTRETQAASFVADIKAQGGTPLTERGGDRVAFVYQGQGGRVYRVAGTWTSWSPTLAMQQIAGTSLHVAETTIARGTRHEYKFVDDLNRWLEDPLTRDVAWDGMNHNTVGEFNGVLRPESGDATKGRLVAWRAFRSATLGNARDVFIYVPAAYDSPTCPRLPSLYFHDGNESLTREPFAVAVDDTYAANPSAAALIAFVALPDQAVRMSEYTFGTAGARGDDYGKFLKDELRPAVEAAFRTCGDPRDRGLAGASLGGLISSYLAFQSPSVWGYVGSQSGSYFWASNSLVTRGGQDPKVDVRFYLDHGCPGDNCDVNRQLNTALVGKGYDVRHIEEANAQHDWWYWKRRLPGLLTYFREGRTGCR